VSDYTADIVKDLDRPRPACDGSQNASTMTIHQQFAAMAMQGYCANGHPNGLAGDADRISALSVRHADALIAALNKPVTSAQ
jgi:hypothetical protein